MGVRVRRGRGAPSRRTRRLAGPVGPRAAPVCALRVQFTLESRLCVGPHLRCRITPPPGRRGPVARRRSHRVAPRGTADFSLRLHGRGRIIRLAARLPSVTSSGARHATGVLSLRHLGGGGASTTVRWGAAGAGSRAGGLPPADEGHPLGPCRRLRGARAPENSIFSPLARRPRRWAIAACGNRGVDAVRSADHQARSRACWERALHRGRRGTTTTTPASRVSQQVHGRSWWGASCS